MSALFRTHLDQYAPAFEEYFVLRRENSILEVRMHTGGGPLRWGAEVHRMLVPLFQAIELDDDNEVVILTGTGDSFNAVPDVESYVRHGATGRWNTEMLAYDLNYRDQVRETGALLALSMPVIAAVNGPLRAHAELALVNDIVLCDDTTWFADAHWTGMGIVPGDGIQIVLRELLGLNRSRHLLYTGERIDAQRALDLGLVAEVLPPDRLLPRAWELAERLFMSRDRIQRRLARATLIQPWRELFTKEIASGMAHECLGAAVAAPLATPGSRLQPP